MVTEACQFDNRLVTGLCQTKRLVAVPTTTLQPMRHAVRLQLLLITLCLLGLSSHSTAQTTPGWPLHREISVGFGEQRLTGYQLNQGDVVRVNFSLQEAGQTLEVVEVVASGLKNKVENFGAATAVTARTISTLPINGRNFTTLTDLSPLAGRGATCRDNWARRPTSPSTAPPPKTPLRRGLPTAVAAGHTPSRSKPPTMATWLIPPRWCSP